MRAIAESPSIRVLEIPRGAPDRRCARRGRGVAEGWRQEEPARKHVLPEKREWGFHQTCLAWMAGGRVDGLFPGAPARLAAQVVVRVREISAKACWMLFGHAFFYDQIELFYHPPFKRTLATFGDIFNLQILQPWELATLGYLFVLFIVSAAHCVVAGFEDKIRTRAYLQFLIDVTLRTDCATAVTMQQSLAVAHDKQQHTDRPPFCADQQQNIEYILHCCHGLPHPFIWF